MFKVGRKRLTATEKQQARDYDWDRVRYILNVDYEPLISQADIWWARKFLRRILADPMVKRGRAWDNETGQARIHMADIDRRFPEQKFKKPKAEKRKLKARPTKFDNARNAVTKNLLKVARARLNECKKQSDYWEIRFSNMAVSNPKWADLHHKVTANREEIKKLETRIVELKGRLI